MNRERFARIIAGRYRVVHLLGEGGMGRVYLVEDLLRDRQRLALKLIAPERTAGGEIERLKAEFRAMAQLRHPGIARAYDFGTEAETGRHYLTREYVDGVPLLQAAHRLPAEALADLFVQICGALHYMHGRGICHHDLKPQNVLVENCAPRTARTLPRARLLDFGLGAGDRSPATLAGTVHYAPPEAFLGGSLDSRSDLYSLGVILYQVLSGRLPFEDAKPLAVINAHLHRQPEPPRAVEPRISRAMEGVILRLLEKDPAKRFRDARETQEAILGAGGGPGAAALPAPEQRPLSGAFVGRRREMEVLLATLAALKEGGNGRPAAALIRGPAGIGKTRLAEEVRRHAQIEEIPVAWAAFHPAVSEPCGAWLDILRQTRAATERPSGEKRAGAGGAAGSEGAGGAGGSEPERARDLPRVLAARLRDHASRGPLVVCLESLQWADALSIETLRRAFDGARRLPLFLFATLREEDAPEPVLAAIRAALHGPACLGIDLEPLDGDEVESLLRSLLGTAQDLSRLAARIRRRTGGNPLFVEETVRSLYDDGTLKFVSGRWRFDADRIGDRIPATVGEIVTHRLGRLHPDDRRLLGILAAFDAPVTAAAAAAVAGATPSQVEARLAEMARGGLLRIEPSGTDGARFEIRHRPLRDVAHEALGPAARDLHRRIGESLEEPGGDPPPDRLDALAWHFVAAGDARRGLEYSMAAARRALGIDANDRARHHLERALPLVGRGDRERRAEVLFRLGETHKRLGDHSAAVRCFRRARETFAQARRHDGVVRALEQIAWCEGAAGRYAVALRSGREALALAERRADREGIAKTLNTIGMVLSRRGESDEAIGYYRRALALWEEIGDPLRLAGTLNNLGLLCLFRGRPEEGREHLERSLALRKEAGERRLAAQSLNNLGLCHRAMGRHDEALRCFDDAQALAGQAESRSDQASALANRGETQVGIGRYDAALDSFERAVALMEETHDLHHLPTCLDGMGLTHRRLGDLAAAASTHGRALEAARAVRDPVQEGYALAALALDRHLLGAAEEADAALREAEGLAGSTGNARLRARVLESRRRIALDRGDAPALAAVADALDPIARESGLREDRLGALLARADARIASREFPDAARLLEEAETLARDLDLAESRREILERLGRCAAETGDAGLAAERFRAAAGEVRRIAAGIADPALRARYLSRPESRAVLDRAAGALPAAAVGMNGEARPGAGRSLLALHDISRAITSILSLDALLERVMDVAIDLVGAERGILFLREGENGEMRIRVARGADRETLADATEHSTRVLRESQAGRSILAVDAGDDDRFRNFQSVSLYHIRSLMCVPLRLQDRVLGTVYLDTRQTRKAFTDEDLRFVEIFAGQAAVAIENARLYSRLEEENRYLKRSLEERYRYGALVGRSPGMLAVYDLLDRLQGTSLPVLIQGESGTGKELVARAIHFQSPRKERPFVTENCAALPDTLVESELFGHLRGAFTGADRAKEGLFVTADGGTLFLDEIADMSPALQSKLLRAIQEGEIRPVGGNTPRKVDVRVLSATNQPPEELISQGKLRQDLYYRLSVVTVALPPLRDRREDVPLLAQHFLDRIAETNRRPPYKVSREAMEALVRFHWPGNVRELENTLSRLALFADDRITLQTIEQDRQTLQKLSGAAEVPSPASSLEEVEKRHIQRVLREAGGDRTRAARLLGISRATIFRKIKEFGLE